VYALIAHLQCKENQDKQRVVCFNFLIALLDVCAFILGLITLLTLWKSFDLIARLRSEYKRAKGNEPLLFVPSSGLTFLALSHR